MVCDRFRRRNRRRFSGGGGNVAATHCSKNPRSLRVLQERGKRLSGGFGRVYVDHYMLDLRKGLLHPGVDRLGYGMGFPQRLVAVYRDLQM